MVKICYALCLVAGFALATSSSAAAPATNSKSVADAASASKKKTRTGSKAESKTDPALEKTAMGLVNQHLPDLRKLLETLKNDNPRQYDAAIRDLVKSARRLQSIKNRDEELFEIEVEMLKTQSSIKLLTAKLKVRDDKSDRDLLRKAAMRMHQAELAKAQYNVRYLTDRFDKAQQQLSAAKKRLESIEGKSESRLEKSYLNFLKNAGRLEKTAKPKKKP